MQCVKKKLRRAAGRQWMMQNLLMVLGTLILILQTLNWNGHLKVSSLRRNLSAMVRPISNASSPGQIAYDSDPSDDLWPKFFLLGTARAASTALFNFLLQHPQVCAGKARGGEAAVKEIGFFGDKSRFEQHGPFHYLSFFRNSSKCAPLRELPHAPPFFLDGSSTALAQAAVPSRMRAAIPRPLHPLLRFVVVLREPVERDRSWTGAVRARHGQALTDAEYLGIAADKVAWLEQGKWEDLRHGFYDEHLDAFFHHFKPHQFLVLSYHSLLADPKPYLALLVSFLGLSPAAFTSTGFALPPNPFPPPPGLVSPLAALNFSLCTRLREVYAPHMDRLYALLQQPGMNPLQPPFPRFPDPCPAPPPPPPQALAPSAQPSGPAPLPPPGQLEALAAGPAANLNQDALALAGPGHQPGREPALDDAWPTVFQLGTGRSGSAAVHAFLTQHPSVCGAAHPNDPTTPRRDPEFFGRANKVEKGGAAAYLSWFRHVPKCKALAAQSKARLYLHASSSYFGNLAVPKRIKDLYPLALHTKLRFLVVLREPVERDRAWSAELRRRKKLELSDRQYLVVLREKLKSLKEGKWEDLHHGFYDDSLQALWKEFPRDQVLVLSFEALRAHPDDALPRIASFLRLSPADWGPQLKLDLLNVDSNKSAITPLATLDPIACSALEQLYAPHNLRLYQMLREPGMSEWQPPFPPFPPPCSAPHPSANARLHTGPRTPTLASAFASAPTAVLESSKDGEYERGGAGGSAGGGGAWPSLFVLGVPRAASTSIFHFLQAHPHVCTASAPSVNGMRGDPKPLKQIDFFNDLKKYEKGAEWYVGHFERSRKCGAILGQNRSGQALDGSMLYFGSKGAAQRMKATLPPHKLPSLRFLLVLREPVSRDRSWSLAGARRRGRKMGDVAYVEAVQHKIERLRHDEWQDLSHGFYDSNLEAFFAEFQRDQFLILNYETLRANESDSLSRIIAHFNLDPSYLTQPHASLPQLAERDEPPTHLAVLNPPLCEELAAIFQPHTLRLYDMLAQPGLSPYQPPFPRFPPACPNISDLSPTTRGVKPPDNFSNVPVEKQPWPTLFHLGVPKSGSTSLFYALMKHPHVCASHKPDNPREEVKEPDYFWRAELYEQGAKGYLAMYDRTPKCDNLRARGGTPYYFDASVKYIFGHKIPKRMKGTIPASLHSKLRFVVVFREPVERDRSWEGHKARMNKRSLSDEAYANGTYQRIEDLHAGRRSDVSNGFYDQHLQFWWNEFRKDQLMVLNYDTMLENETDTLIRVVQHMGLDLSLIEDQLRLPKVNMAPKREKVTPLSALNPGLCSQLKSLFEPHVQSLYAMLNSPGMSPFQPPFPHFDDPCPSPSAPAVAAAPRV